MTISFPHLGDYCVPIEAMLRMLFPRDNVLVPPPTSKRTIEAGAKYSPEFVCVPFKYNLGNMLEALEAGADTIVVAGGGCRYGYYAELQEQILRDLGYDFILVNIFGSGGFKVRESYEIVKKIGSKVSFVRFIYVLLLTVRTVTLMDKTDKYIRANIGFETESGSFGRLKKEFHNELRRVRSFAALRKAAKKYKRALRQLPLVIPTPLLHIGIVGELYTVMDASANYFLERELAKYNARVSRFTDATYLLFVPKKFKERKNLRDAGGCVKYYLGADGTHSAAKCRALANSDCDGVIHVKPFGCAPEINAIPALMSISKTQKIPILFMSFDAQTSETGVRTRIEAFVDMVKMKKTNNSPLGRGGGKAEPTVRLADCKGEELLHRSPPKRRGADGVVKK